MTELQCSDLFITEEEEQSTAGDEEQHPRSASPLSMTMTLRNAGALSAQQQRMARHQDIVEIALHFPDDELPGGWILLTHTLEGGRANLDSQSNRRSRIFGGSTRSSGSSSSASASPGTTASSISVEELPGVYLAYRRRGMGDLMPGIAEMMVLPKGDTVIPDGFEVIDTSATGRSTQDSNAPRLACRRQRYDQRHRFYEDRAIAYLVLLTSPPRPQHSLDSAGTSAASSSSVFNLLSSSAALSSTRGSLASTGSGAGSPGSSSEAAMVEAAGFTVLEDNLGFKSTSG